MAHPSKTMNGIQKRMNLMDRSMARALARVAGGVFLPRKYSTEYLQKNPIATRPSAANETIGRRISPNHLRRELALVISFVFLGNAYSSVIPPVSRTNSILSTSCNALSYRPATPVETTYPFRGYSHKRNCYGQHPNQDPLTDFRFGMSEIFLFVQ